MGNARPIDGRPQSEVQVGPDKLEVVASFCYLGDMLSAGGGCEMAVTTRVKTAWKKFRELLPVLTSRHLSYKTRGHVYSSCVRSAMLHASETWPLTKTNLQRLQRNDRAMIRQICSIKPEDVARVRSSELLAKLQLEDLDLILRERRLRWFGHVARSSGAIRTAYDMQIDGKRGAGRPKQTWKKLTEKDCREWKLTTVDPQERIHGSLLTYITIPNAMVKYITANIFTSNMHTVNSLSYTVTAIQWKNNVIIAPDKAAYCVFTQFRGPENAIKFISVRTKTQ